MKRASFTKFTLCPLINKFFYLDSPCLFRTRLKEELFSFDHPGLFYHGWSILFCPHTIRVALEVNQPSRSTYLLEAYRATGSTYL